MKGFMSFRVLPAFLPVSLALPLAFLNVTILS